jgi:hypothetical protein
MWILRELKINLGPSLSVFQVNMRVFRSIHSYLTAGGALVVKHNAREVKYDWHKDSGEAVQWAAFYGDCLHEVLPVNKGYRVTITYNLYFNDSISRRTNIKQSCSSLPLYDVLSKALKSKEFMPDGTYSPNELTSKQAVSWASIALTTMRMPATRSENVSPIK